MEKRTSKDWYNLVPKKYELKMFDHDGWNNITYNYSFNEELITKKEFIKRVVNSAISCKFLTNFINEWK